MRLELADGQHAELRERLTYAQARDLRAAFLKAQQDTDAAADLPMALMRAYVSAWNVQDYDSHALALEQAEQAPDDVLIEISAAAIDLWNATSKDLPKAGNGISPGMQPELPSELTQNLETSSSLPDIPAGVGPI